jgi:hypothetical protein
MSSTILFMEGMEWASRTIMGKKINDEKMTFTHLT